MNKFMIPFVIIEYLVLLFFLIINIRKSNKLFKYCFIAFLFITLFALDAYDNTMLDSIIGFIIRYIYYPTYFSYTLTFALSIIMLIITVFSNKIYDKVKIINFIFGSLIILSYIIFLLLKIDTNSYKVLYSGNSLICLRYMTRTFTLWTLVLLIRQYYKYFVKKW